MRLKLKDQLRKHGDGYYVARIIVGTLRIGNEHETMIMVDPCLTLDDRTEEVSHYAIVNNRLSLRSNGLFRKFDKPKYHTAHTDARLLQMAIGTWEYCEELGDSGQTCACYPNFFDKSVSHNNHDECSIRRLCGIIAEYVRANGDVDGLLIPETSSSTNQ